MPHRIDTEGFGFLVTDIARMMRAEMDRCIGEAGLGITPGEARALAQVARAGAVRQSILAERIGIEAMTLSTYVDRLEQQGLVQRSVDPSDRRARLVSLTTDAADMLDAIVDIAHDVRERTLSGVDAPGRERLDDLLRTVRANLCDISGRDRSAA